MRSNGTKIGRRASVIVLEAATMTLRRVCESPATFPVVQEFIRGARVFGFPYTLYFADEQSKIVVYAVFNERRRPGTWRHREVDD